MKRKAVTGLQFEKLVEDSFSTCYIESHLESLFKLA